MIRILHSVSNMDRAGIETMLMNYYRHMDHTKIQFDFLCNKKKPGAYDDEIRELGGRIFRTPGLNPGRYPQYLSFMKVLFRDYPEYRIVEAHNGALGVYALHAAKVNKIPVRIFHAHGATITKDWKLPIKLVCKSLLPMNMNQRFTCGVAAAKCYFGKKLTDAGEFVLIPNAIEIEQFSFESSVRERMREKYGLTDKHVVGHVGRFMAQKNHTFLLDAFAAFKKKDRLAHLVLLGDGELMPAIKEKAEQLGIANSVSFVGAVSNVNEWYQAFDLFVLPSIWEGLPVVGVEAQAADLPCIFAKSITAEIGILEKTQFVGLEESLDNWTAAMCRALSMTGRKNVRDVIAAHGYDIYAEAEKLQERYLKLAGEQNENWNINTPLCQ